MWYYLPDWFKWFKGRPQKNPQEEALSDIIKRRALEQNAIIDRKDEVEETKVEAKVAEKDLFE
jgi:hypothetical protein